MHPDTTDLLVESPQFSTSIATTVCDNHLIHSAKAHQFDKLSPRDPPSMTIPCLESDLTELNSPPSMPMASSMSPLTFVSKRLLSDFIDSSNFNNEKHHQGNSQHGLLMNPGLSPVSSLFRAYEEVATQQPGRLTPHLMPGVGRCAFMDDSMEPEAESGLGHIEPKANNRDSGMGISSAGSGDIPCRRSRRVGLSAGVGLTGSNGDAVGGRSCGSGIESCSGEPGGTSSGVVEGDSVDSNDAHGHMCAGTGLDSTSGSGSRLEVEDDCPAWSASPKLVCPTTLTAPNSSADALFSLVSFASSASAVASIAKPSSTNGQSSSVMHNELCQFDSKFDSSSIKADCNKNRPASLDSGAVLTGLEGADVAQLQPHHHLQHIVSNEGLLSGHRIPPVCCAAQSQLVSPACALFAGLSPRRAAPNPIPGSTPATDILPANHLTRKPAHLPTLPGVARLFRASFGGTGISPNEEDLFAIQTVGASCPAKQQLQHLISPRRALLEEAPLPKVSSPYTSLSSARLANTASISPIQPVVNVSRISSPTSGLVSGLSACGLTQQMIGRVLFDSDTPGESDATSGNSSLGLLPTVRRAVAGTTIEEEEVDEASTASTTGPSAAVSTVESAAYRPGVISAGTGNGSAKAGFNNGRLCTMADLSRLNPSLAAAVAQISGETGTSTADLVAGLAEVRRRPTDARNRLRRLGGVGSPSGQSSHGLSLTPTSKTNTAIASAGAGAGQVGDSASAGISKRLSLPASMNLPPHLWPRATRFLGETMTRRERRLSLVSQFA